MFEVQVSEGDITAVESDALITVVNSEGLWFGGIDEAIRRVAGNAFHNRARHSSLRDGAVVYAPAPSAIKTPFRSVIFVIDDLKQPLRSIVLTGLLEANARGCRKVTMPSFRTGVMQGAFERTKEQALEELALGIRSFRASEPDSTLTNVEVVIYRDPAAAQHLRTELQ